MVPDFTILIIFFFFDFAAVLLEPQPRQPNTYHRHASPASRMNYSPQRNSRLAPDRCAGESTCDSFSNTRDAHGMTIVNLNPP